MIYRGAAPRKLQPDRWPSTTDDGAPSKSLPDESVVPVPSINNLSRQFPHPLAQRPTPRNLANQLALLDHVAHLAGEQTTSSSSPTTLRITSPTSSLRRRHTGFPLSPPCCSPATRASLTTTSLPSWQSMF
eukprot:4075570-Pleurochrysis_carterae.AAC.1